MTPTSRMLLLSAISVILAATSCKKDDDNPPIDINPPAEDVVNKYSGAATPGSQITFEINQTDFAYAIHNETEGDSYGGLYTIMTGDHYGIYNLKANYSNYYAVEMSDKIVAANYKSVMGNAITYCVSQDVDNTANIANIAGDYIYIAFSDAAVNGSLNHKEWGVLTAGSDGSLLLKAYSTGGSGTLTTMGPENFNLPLPLTSGDITGTWSVNGTDKERLDVTLSSVPGATFTGYSYATADGSCFILNRGTDNGFVMGLRIMNYTPSQLAGTYSYAGKRSNGEVCADKISIGAAGTGIIHTVDKDLTASYGELDSLNQCSSFQNVVYGDFLTGIPLNVTGKIYLAIVNEMTMYIMIDNFGNFYAYGLGGKK